MSLVINNKNISDISLMGKTVKDISINGKLVWLKGSAPTIDGLTFTCIDGTALQISIIETGTLSEKLFEYSLNNIDWIPYPMGHIFTIYKNEFVSFRSLDDLSFSEGSSKYRQFNIGGGLCRVDGSVEYITKINSSYSCYCMFKDCISLVNGPKLPATTLYGSYCYGQMFNGCINLKTAPKLPATTLSGYCYYLMFYNCTSLRNAPELPATTLKSNCYRNMFANCTSLVTAPKLPATTLANYCYYGMFEYCTSLVTAPKLPATTLASSSYHYMFQGCSNIRYVYCNIMYESSSALITTLIGTSWLNGLPNKSTCIFYKNPEWTGPTKRNSDTIPSNWQILDWVQE